MLIYARPVEESAKAILASCNLPTEDLTANSFDCFFACGPEAAPTGIVGVELYGEVALLRSLAVLPEMRGAGCGKRLVAEAESYAAANGVKEIYLLTTGAEPFFRSLGYEVVNRDRAPEKIRSTSEFSSICPSTAAVLRKQLIP
jgi:amino-acid N-acetyltransferase